MSIRLGKAIWKSSEYDIPVEVIRYLGTTDGIKYYLVQSEAGKTGVPEIELSQESKYPKTLHDLIKVIFGD